MTLLARFIDELLSYYHSMFVDFWKVSKLSHKTYSILLL